MSTQKLSNALWQKTFMMFVVMPVTIYFGIPEVIAGRTANNCNNNYVGYVSNEKGTIQLISSRQEDWYVIIPDYDDTQRFLPDKLPDRFKKDELKVIFSGKICEIPENARLIGIPLILTSIDGY